MSQEPSPEEEWMQRVRDELIPRLASANTVVSLIPDGLADVKYAVELGFSILMDKPMIFFVRPGTTVPKKMIAVADRILEVSDDDWANPDKLQERVFAALEGLDRENREQASVVSGVLDPDDEIPDPR